MWQLYKYVVITGIISSRIVIDLPVYICYTEKNYQFDKKGDCMKTLDSLSRQDLLSLLQNLIKYSRMRNDYEHGISNAEFQIRQAYEKREKSKKTYSRMKMIGYILLSIIVFIFLVGIIEMATVSTSNKLEVIIMSIIITFMGLFLSIIASPVLIIWGSMGLAKLKKDNSVEQAAASIQPHIAEYKKNLAEINRILIKYYSDYSIREELRYIGALEFCYNEISYNSKIDINTAYQRYEQEAYRQAQMYETRKLNEDNERRHQEEKKKLDEIQSTIQKDHEWRKERYNIWMGD